MYDSPLYPLNLGLCIDHEEIPIYPYKYIKSKSKLERIESLPQSFLIPIMIVIGGPWLGLQVQGSGVQWINNQGYITRLEFSYFSSYKLNNGYFKNKKK